MIWFILAGILVLICVIISICYREFGMAFMALVPGSFVGAIAALLICIIVGGFISLSAPMTTVTFGETPLLALVDNAGSTGSFFLGSGNVRGELYYYYVTEDSLGYKTRSIKASNCHIKYTKESPRIVTYGYRFADENLYWWGVNMNDSDTVLEIPEGSIDMRFDVDLE